MTRKPQPMGARGLYQRLTNRCDICGRRRGGGNKIDHSKCARLRQKRG